MNKKIKFSDLERQSVINRIESLKNIRLSPIGRRKKFLLGSDNNYYCIVGGCEDWHGSPKDIMARGINNPTNTFIVVARLLSTRIEIYIGSMKPIIDSRDALKHTKTGDYQFDLIGPDGNRLGIKQVAGCKLIKISEFNYDVVMKRDQDNKLNEFIKSLSPADLEILKKELGIIKIDS